MDAFHQEKFEAACARLKARYLELRASRPCIQITDKVPGKEGPLKVPPRKQGATCKATCLNGNKCKFKAGLGGFCAKHYTPPLKKP